MTTQPTRSKDRDTFVENRSLFRRILLPALLFAVALGFLFLPTIVVNSPLKEMALEYVTSEINGEIRVGEISAGWLAPISISNVSVRDVEQNEIATVAEINTSQTLLGFLTSPSYGELIFDQPVVDLDVREDGSNLEDVLANLLNGDTEDSNTGLPKIKVKIVDGSLQVRSNTLSQSGIMENINANIRLMDDGFPLAGELQMNCSADGVRPGIFHVEFQADEHAADLDLSKIQATIDAQQFPLAALAPALTRLIGPNNCAGIFDSQCSIAIDSVAGTIDTKIQSLQGQQIAVVAPNFFGSDQVTIRFLNAAGELHLDSNHGVAKEFKLESEFAKLTANGEFEFNQLARLGSGSSLPASDFQLDGAVDLAQVAAMLPETSHLRDGVTVKSGLLQLTANTRNENQTQRMVVNLETANMNFMVDGQDLNWHQPLRIVAVAGENNGRLTLEQFQLNSDFLKAEGYAALDRGQMKIQGDLEKVIDQLNQVLDTGGLKVGGQVDGQLRWHLALDQPSTASTPIQLVGDFQVEKPTIGYPDMQPWHEDQLRLSVESTALVDASNGHAGLDDGRFNLVIGNEKLLGTLAQPIERVSSATKFQFKCKATGSIARWISQAKNFVEIPAFFADGNLKTEFLATYSPQAVRLNQIQLEATDFNFDGFALAIREPKISGRLNLKYQFQDGSVQFTKSKLTSPTFAANTDSLVFGFTPEKILADGAVNFRANANRASHWMGLSMPGDSVRWDGTATGTMNFSSASNQFGGELMGKVVDLVFVQPVATRTSNQTIKTVSNTTTYEEFWREPDVRVKTEVMMDDDFDGMKLQKLVLKSRLADAQINGRIDELSQSMLANLQGQWNLKWDNVNSTIREMAGDVVEFQGKGWQPIQISGSLYDESGNYAWIPNDLGGNASISWDQVSIFKMPMGQSKIEVQLSQSLARLSSHKNQSILDNLFSAQPILDLRNADPVVHLNRGRLLDQWQVSVDDSRTWLKYAAPLIADATAAQGRISTDLDGASIPLFDPTSSSAKGTLEIHELSIGPGPLVQQMIPLIDRILSIVKPGSNVQQRQAWMQMKPQQLPFLVERGRVHHEGFEMSYKDVVVRTRGSVGFDQSLDLVAEIPIVADWVGDDKYLSRMAGKSLSIPIAGTLSKPQLDRRSATQLVQQLLRESAMGAVNEKVNSEVGKLQNQVQGEIQKFQGQVNDKIQNKLQDEFRNGLKNLFGNDKKK